MTEEGNSTMKTDNERIIMIQQLKKENEQLQRRALACLRRNNDNQSLEIMTQQMNTELMNDKEDEKENLVVNSGKPVTSQDDSHMEEEELFYKSALQNLEKLHNELVEQKNKGETKIVKLQKKLNEKEKQVDEIKVKLETFEHNIVSEALNGGNDEKGQQQQQSSEKKKKNKEMKETTTNNTVNDLLARCNEKKQTLEEERTKTIRSKIEVKKMERKLHAKDEVAMHMDLFGLEQLHSDNKLFTKKYNDRENELQKLSQKKKAKLSEISQTEETINELCKARDQIKNSLLNADKCFEEKQKELLKLRKKNTNPSNRESKYACSIHLDEGVVLATNQKQKELLQNDHRKTVVEIEQLTKRLNELNVKYDNILKSKT